MVYIVNLSSAHKLYSINEGYKAFVELCDKYSNARHCCGSSLFAKFTNYAWVAWQYRKHLHTVINPYKLGKISTEDFLEKMCQVFKYLESARYEDATVKTLFDRRKALVALKEVATIEQLWNDKKLIAKALLEQAWNAIINVDQESINKFNFLFKTKNEAPIYFISNTNELNINKILFELKSQFPEIGWVKNIDISTKTDPYPVKIADDVYFFLSYRCGSFKTAKDQRAAQLVGTPVLLEKLVNYLQSDITVISQYEKDLEAAHRLGVKSVGSEYFYPHAAVTYKDSHDGINPTSLRYPGI